MSGNVKFNAVAPAPMPAAAKKAAEKPRAILPCEFLLSLQGRRVVVFLSYQDHELEGRLAAVDADKGDLFLEDVVHFVWSHGAAGGKLREGTRTELRRCSSAMVNSRYIEIITPA
ncbi:uncharacterized protein Tco025E_04763 [Trypanosoma conorhini]|uniref:Uncharacterized protein n=1 Tax=Trypanosoma conorhini TaxID=83891 RepID=A0A3R7MMN4_9TRYP|nr:uncharacterized protein Tco025E_04763 [Trypanosoma conorhini]RNF17727.1 hypothetical protein Tco025E_04763 [Trypanosoma conorhini]